MDANTVNPMKLSLVLKDIYTNSDEEEDFLIDPENPFLQVEAFSLSHTAIFDICLEGEQEPVGHIHLDIIRRMHLDPSCADEFWSILDEHSDELMQFATAVFTDTGVLKKEVYAPTSARGGGRTNAWSAGDARRLKDQPILYMEELFVKEPWRNKGIGTWAIKNIFKADPVRTEQCDYLMAWPTVLSQYEPQDLTSRSHPFKPTPEEERAFHVKRERIVSYYQKIGFRRLGTSQFFMLAKDTGHPSRHLRPEDDLPFVETK
ncbi:hypothetical protein SCHPADRAFT_998319 [Schizopora paradoxa]|uniref:N-acetyltransferase domain-containing protein n=1 Tax=Schizopora paradoxa TaxID=27342 RepID=A0A0H2RKT1_9AGAM|nr:hypothetical protein SCHPADRAFT_998319 [Schizopora paradoxa]